jgi:hypothetical protein
MPDLRDRPLDALREETIDRLIANYGHGRISQPELEHRLDVALEAGEHAVLTALVADLDPDIDPRSVERKRAELRERAPRDTVEDVRYLVSIFGATQRSGAWSVPDEIRAISLFGAIKLDLSDAALAGRSIRIRVLCLFGGIEIFVPQPANVSVETFCAFGGVSDRSTGSTEPNTPNILVDGLVMFGGADVKVRKDLRRKLMELADTMRGTFGYPGSPSR